MRPSSFIGIDPDTKGAICVLTYDGGEPAATTPNVTLIDTPVVQRMNITSGKKQTHFNPYEMARALMPYRGNQSFAVIEQMMLFRGDYPGKGTLIEGYALWQMACTILGIPFVCVQPAVWKKHFGYRDGDKEHAILLARLEFEYVANQFSSDTHGRADAALQAKYAHDKYDEWVKNGQLFGGPLNTRNLLPSEIKPTRKKK